jgi:hypothetical protein
VASAVSLTPGAAAYVPIGGTSIVAVYGGVQGAIICNPLAAADQGLVAAETLYVDPTKPAVLFANSTCKAIASGQFYFVPPGDSISVWVNAASSGHQFSCVVIQPPVQSTPTPITGAFPPTGPSGLTSTLPSYLYKEYEDDDSLQAFVISYNALAQEFADWFNSINLPIYTQPQIYGLLLDWVAAGIYGLTRPVLSSGRPKVVGPYNTVFYNQRGAAFNVVEKVGALNVAVTSDDVFKRIITWHFYKGDGKYLSTRWLKRRVARFLFGASGTDYEGNTYQISVSFGDDEELNITILSGIRKPTAASVFNYIPGVARSGSYFNRVNSPYNSFNSTFTAYSIPALAFIFQEAVNTGALEMPLQFSPVIVNIYPRGIGTPINKTPLRIVGAPVVGGGGVLDFSSGVMGSNTALIGAILA